MFSIVPHARMDVLSGFYAQGVKVEVVVQEDLQIKAAGDDVKGVWVLDRFNQAAAELGVTDFVVPLEEGGAVVPAIPCVDEYVQAFAQKDVDWVIDLERNFPMRERLFEMLRQEHERALDAHDLQLKEDAE